MLLDLGDVSYVDSAGLGQLVQVHATTRHHGGSLKLLNLTKRLKDLLVLTKLLTVFDSYDEAEAIGSFNSVARTERSARPSPDALIQRVGNGERERRDHGVEALAARS